MEENNENKESWKWTHKKRATMKDTAAALFTDLMIERLEKIEKSNWKMPWVTDMSFELPCNYNGRPYNGVNSMMLMFNNEKQGYKLPVYLTSSKIHSFNYEKDKKNGKPAWVKDSNGNKLPPVHILKGEKSFPVYLSMPYIKNKETGQVITIEQYNGLSQTEKKEYNNYRSTQVYWVYNIDQTNFAEARPELYRTLQDKYLNKEVKRFEHDFSFEPIDRMIKDQAWICPFSEKDSNAAVFRMLSNIIEVPNKERFEEAEYYYGTVLHEMAHSTGVEEYLDRNLHGNKNDYAKEELLAELTAAFVAKKYGMNKPAEGDSAQYLKSWLDSLRKDPKFIVDILYDMKKAAALIDTKIQEVIVKLDIEKGQQYDTVEIKTEIITYKQTLSDAGDMLSGDVSQFEESTTKLGELYRIYKIADNNCKESASDPSLSAEDKDALLRELLHAKNEFSEALRLSMLNVQEHKGVSNGQPVDEPEKGKKQSKDDIREIETVDVVIDENGDAQMKEDEELSPDRKQGDYESEEEDTKHHKAFSRGR